MLTMHIIQSGPSYQMDSLYVGNEAGLILCLRAKDITKAKIMKVWKG